MIQTQCPICLNEDFEPFLTCRDYTATGESFEIVNCKTCHFKITYPAPLKENIAKYYQSTSYISHSNTATSLTDKIYLVARNHTLKWKNQIISEYHPTRGKLLDFGCGTGQFVSFCHKEGWEINGIEPSEDAKKAILPNLQSRIHTNLSTLSEKKFDVITLWHVLEHVHELNTTFKDLKDKLAKTGTMFIAVPNPESWDAKKYSAFWAAYDVPRHLWHFSQKNITDLTHNHGMHISKTIPMKLDAFYVSMLSERYQNNNAESLTGKLRAITNGIKSNSYARRNKGYSSLIYVIKK